VPRPIMARKIDITRERIIAVLAAGASASILMVLFGCTRPPRVEVTRVTREDLTSTITSNGKVEPISPTTAHAEFPTFVDKVMATEGQPVHRGEVIVTLDAADVRAQLAQARNELLAARTSLQNARTGGPPDQVAQLSGDLQQAQSKVANTERKQAALTELVAKQAATQEELAQNQAALVQVRALLQALEQRSAALTQQAKVDATSAELRMKQAQDQVASLEEKVRSAAVIAPSDGTLYSLPVHPGDYVKVGDVLAEMADLRQIRVRAFVDEPDLGWLAPGEDVQVNWDAMPNRTWTGKVEQVPKQVVARGTRSVGEVVCSVKNDKGELLPNVNVEVRIVVRKSPGALVVPRVAVQYDKGQHYVFILAGKTVHRRDITVGVASDTEYEVLSGLALGDKVALPRGDLNLKDGMEIRATEAK
jgi:HlyD family secretion protein